MKTAFFRTLDLEIQNLKKEKKNPINLNFFGDFSCRNSASFSKSLVDVQNIFI